MQLPDLKKLDQLLALLRKRGVQSIEIDGIKLVLGSIPDKAKRQAKAAPIAAPALDLNPLDPVSDGWDSLSEEQKLMWSVGELKVPTPGDESPGALN